MKKNYRKELQEITEAIEDTSLLEIIKHYAFKISNEIEGEEESSLDDIDWLLFEGDMILEAIDRKNIAEINVLTALILLLNEWGEDVQFVNKTLGL